MSFKNPDKLKKKKNIKPIAESVKPGSRKPGTSRAPKGRNEKSSRG